MTANPFRAAARHLDAHEEAWKAEHDRAMGCFDLEEWLSACVWVYDLIEFADDLFRSRVFRGIAEPGTGHAQVQEGYRRWLAIAAELAREVPRMTADYGPLAQADEFADRMARVKERMARQPQRLAIAPGSREWVVTLEEAQQLMAVAAAPPPVKLKPLHIPDGPASLIR